MKKYLNKSVLFGLTIFLLIASNGESSDKKIPPGDFGKAHSHLEKSDCSTCHSNKGVIKPTKCLSCHDKIALRIAEKRGYHQDKNEDCGTCHNEHQGVNSSLIEIDESNFDHSETGYILRGMHKNIKNCRSCHSSSRTVKRKKFSSFLLLDNKCTVCHSSPHPGIKKDCEECHDEKSWAVDNWRN